MTTNLETLRAELAAAEAEAQAEQQRQAGVLREAQKEWSADLLRLHKQREQQLEDEGNASMDAAAQALRDGDLPAAYFNYVGWHASRSARQRLRSEAQSAVNRVPEHQGGTVPDLRIVDVNFTDWLNTQGEKIASSQGADRYEEILGADIPTNYEDAKAWLEANRGN